MKHILIVCSHFWPSTGGLESRMGQFSRELIVAGYKVDVLTQAYPGRDTNLYHGVEILSAEIGVFSNAIKEAVQNGKYRACILIQDPLGEIIWSIENIKPHPRTSIYIQPIINEDGYLRWKNHPNFGERLSKILKENAKCLVMTKNGPDTQYMDNFAIDAIYVPNATMPIQPAGNFREKYGISEDVFLILHVANLYWVKNHLGLIKTLSNLPANWKLVMIGNPSGEKDCVDAVYSELKNRPDILFIPGLSSEWISSAMIASNVVVLASKGEGSPITILEAMSHGKPWIATPECGAANDHLGGIISKLKEFKYYLNLIYKNKKLRDNLGLLSYEHWKESYSWKAVMKIWISLIENKNELNPIAESMMKEITKGEFSLADLIEAGQKLMNDGRFDNAAEIYQFWIKNNNSDMNFVAYFNLATIFESLGQIENAKQAYEKSLKINPTFEIAKVNLNRIQIA